MRGARSVFVVMNSLVLTALVLMDPVKSGTVQRPVISLATLAVEQRLCRERIVSIEPSPYGGCSVKLMIRFAGGSKAVFKPNQERYSARYQAEIAAYRLATHLGVSRVPPACERSILLGTLMVAAAGPGRAPLRERMSKELRVGPTGRVLGAAIHWLPKVVDVQLESKTNWHAWLVPGAAVPKAKMPLAKDIADMLLLDLLFSNSDRFTGGNTLSERATGRLLMIDNGAAFRQVRQLNRPYHRVALGLLGRVRRRTFRRLLGLTRRTLDAVLGRPGVARSSYLSRRERSALLRRRDLLLVHIRQLVRKHGAKAVFLH